MKTIRNYLKACSIILLVVFALQSSSALAGSPAYSVSVSSDVGNVRERWKQVQNKPASLGEYSPQLVIIVQDAHESFSAQKNIANIIHQLLPTYSSNNTIFGVEGALTPLGVDRLRTFPVPDVRAAVSERMIQKGYLTGAEHAVLTADEPITVYGLEDEELFHRNYQSFYNLAENRELIEQYIKAIQYNIELLKRRIFSDELMSLDNASQQFQNGSITCQKYCAALYQYAQATHIDVLKYPYVQLFHELLMTLNHIDEKQVLNEIHQLYPLCHNGERLNARKLPDQSFLFQLHARAEEKKCLECENYPAFMNLIACYNRFSQIDVSVLYEQLLKLNYEIQTAVAKTNDARLLVRAAYDATVLEKTLTLKATQQEALYVNDTNPDRFVQDMFVRLNQLLEQYHFPRQPKGMYADIKTFLGVANNYYRCAAERDDVLVSALLDKMYTQHKPYGVLIAGGFHTPGMTKILQAKNIEYVVIAPALFDDDSALPYLDRMLGRFNEQDISIAHSFESSRFVANMDSIYGTEQGQKILQNIFAEYWETEVMRHDDYAQLLVQLRDYYETQDGEIAQRIIVSIDAIFDLIAAETKAYIQSPLYRELNTKNASLDEHADNIVVTEKLMKRLGALSDLIGQERSRSIQENVETNVADIIQEYKKTTIAHRGSLARALDNSNRPRDEIITYQEAFTGPILDMVKRAYRKLSDGVSSPGPVFKIYLSGGGGSGKTFIGHWFQELAEREFSELDRESLQASADEIRMAAEKVTGIDTLVSQMKEKSTHDLRAVAEELQHIADEIDILASQHEKLIDVERLAQLQKRISHALGKATGRISESVYIFSFDRYILQKSDRPPDVLNPEKTTENPHEKFEINERFIPDMNALEDGIIYPPIFDFTERGRLKIIREEDNALFIYDDRKRARVVVDGDTVSLLWEEYNTADGAWVECDTAAAEGIVKRFNLNIYVDATGAPVIEVLNTAHVVIPDVNGLYSGVRVDDTYWEFSNENKYSVEMVERVDPQGKIFIVEGILAFEALKDERVRQNAIAVYLEGDFWARLMRMIVRYRSETGRNETLEEFVQKRFKLQRTEEIKCIQPLLAKTEKLMGDVMRVSVLGRTEAILIAFIRGMLDRIDELEYGEYLQEVLDAFNIDPAELCRELDEYTIQGIANRIGRNGEGIARGPIQGSAFYVFDFNEEDFAVLKAPRGNFEDVVGMSFEEFLNFFDKVKRRLGGLLVPTTRIQCKEHLGVDSITVPVRAGEYRTFTDFLVQNKVDPLELRMRQLLAARKKYDARLAAETDPDEQMRIQRSRDEANIQLMELIDSYFTLQRELWKRGVVDMDPKILEKYGMMSLEGREVMVVIGVDGLQADDDAFEGYDPSLFLRDSERLFDFFEEYNALDLFEYYMQIVEQLPEKNDFSNARMLTKKDFTVFSQNSEAIIELLMSAGYLKHGDIPGTYMLAERYWSILDGRDMDDLMILYYEALQEKMDALKGVYPDERTCVEIYYILQQAGGFFNEHERNGGTRSYPVAGIFDPVISEQHMTHITDVFIRAKIRWLKQLFSDRLQPAGGEYQELPAILYWTKVMLDTIYFPGTPNHSIVNYVYNALCENPYLVQNGADILFVIKQLVYEGAKELKLNVSNTEKGKIIDALLAITFEEQESSSHEMPQAVTAEKIQKRLKKMRTPFSHEEIFIDQTVERINARFGASTIMNNMTFLGVVGEKYDIELDSPAVLDASSVVMQHAYTIWHRVLQDALNNSEVVIDVNQLQELYSTLFRRSLSVVGEMLRQKGYDDGVKVVNILDELLSSQPNFWNDVLSPALAVMRTFSKRRTQSLYVDAIMTAHDVFYSETPSLNAEDEIVSVYNKMEQIYRSEDIRLDVYVHPALRNDPVLFPLIKNIFKFREDEITINLDAPADGADLILAFDTEASALKAVKNVFYFSHEMRITVRQISFFSVALDSVIAALLSGKTDETFAHLSEWQMTTQFAANMSNASLNLLQFFRDEMTRYEALHSVRVAA